MKIGLSILAICLLVCTQIWAKDKFNFSGEFEKRTLVWIPFIADEKVVEKLESKGGKAAVEAFYEEMNHVNTMVAESFTKHWDKTPFQVMSNADFNNLSDYKKEKYVAMRGSHGQLHKISFIFFDFEQTYFNKYRNVKTANEVYKVSDDTGLIQEGDIIYLIQKIKVKMGWRNEYDRESLSAFLDSKTLLLPESDKYSKEDLEKVYPHPYKFISDVKEIIDAKNSLDDRYLYIKLEFVDDKPNSMDYITDDLPNFMLIDAETGNAISRSRMSGVTGINYKTSGREYVELTVPNALGRYSTTLRSQEEVVVHMVRFKASLTKAVIKVLVNPKVQQRAYKNLTPN